MVIDGFDPEAAHQVVEGERGGPLEPGIRLPLFPHAIDDVVSFQVLPDHLGDDMDVVLQVRVDGNDDVAQFLGRLQTGHQRVLVAHIAREVHSADILVLRMEALDDRPGPVLGTVIDQQQPAVRAHQAVTGAHPVQQGRHPAHRLFQDGFFVVARNRDDQYGRGILHGQAFSMLVSPIRYTGRRFVSLKMRPRYSPMMPRQRSWMPPSMRMTVIRVGNPATGSP